ncbi:hypothetical protein AVEN_41920-1 [Araneus ventricosus]|uniref:Uncharacterized protein n=1 Tax=Araneus ventricosus TaxID=182803 RepID=A0A4Y2AD81_ARAVE|nr:hypothetical protein AVEN_41920-1 [Araneus ventricosus]
MNNHQKIQHDIGLIVIKYKGLAEFLRVIVVFLLDPSSSSSSCSLGVVSSIHQCLTFCFFCSGLTFSKFQSMLVHVFIILLEKVGLPFDDIRIIFLFGPDETSKVKTVPYGKYPV